jgi:hypothetical protein
MGGQGSGIFSAYMSSTSNATPQEVVFPLAGRVFIPWNDVKQIIPRMKELGQNN